MRYFQVRGGSVAECLGVIREKYGKSAIIVSQEEVSDGGLFGSGLLQKKRWIVKYMVPEDDEILNETPAFRRSPSSLSRTQIVSERPKTGEATARILQKSADMMTQKAERLVSEIAKADRNSGGDDSSFEHLKSVIESRPETKIKVAPSATESPDFSKYTREELGALFSVHPDEDDNSAQVARVVPMRPHTILSSNENEKQKTKQESSPEKMPSGRPLIVDEDRSKRQLNDFRKRLETSQMSELFIGRIMDEIEATLSMVDRKEPKKIEEKSISALVSKIRISGEIAPPAGECKAVLLFGPTGSGKTTSIAKIAAKYSLYMRRDISLYSLDHYRLAATEQLKIYADVLQVPFYAPYSTSEFRETIDRDSAEIMLVDTSGIGYKDKERLDQLKCYIDICPVRIEKHLVIAANTSPSLLDKMMGAYDDIGFDKIIMTKLDEADFIGSIVESADTFNRPFSYVMNGQKVPEDIFESGAEELADIVIQRVPVGI